jgi:hypothetical protein
MIHLNLAHGMNSTIATRAHWLWPVCFLVSVCAVCVTAYLIWGPQ